MSPNDLEVPRLVYRGEPDAKADPKVDDTYEAVETKVVQDRDELDAALRDGWRLRRVPILAKPAKVDEPVDDAKGKKADDAKGKKADDAKGKK